MNQAVLVGHVASQAGLDKSATEGAVDVVFEAIGPHRAQSADGRT